MRRPPLLLALVVAPLVACDGGRTVAPSRVQLAAVDTLHPGAVVQLRGTGLTGLRALLVDGVAATGLVVRSDSVAEFRVPTLRACETDMRAVQVTAGGAAAIDAVVRVAPTVALRAGESRVLGEPELQCLRLAAADEDWVLSAANLAIPTAEVESPRTLVSVRVLGTGGAAMPAAAASREAAPPLEPAMPDAPALAGALAEGPVPFDPRYATAAVGDTLRFVDWFAGTPGICTLPAESVPSFPARVVAVAGQVVVVLDLRHPSAAAYQDPATLGWLREAAAMTDRLLLPTMRSVFDPDYAPPAGGGGRFWLKLGSMPPVYADFAGFAYDGPLPTVNIASQASCPRSSEMVVSTINAQRLTLPQYQDPSWVAGLFLHEYAHSADALTSRRGRIAGILGEGLATLAEETASRIASGQPIGARHAAVGSDAPGSVSGAAFGMWGTQPQLGPWQSNGRYGANARMLLFVRELAGEASVDHGRRPTLYQRLIYAPVSWIDRPAVIGLITSTLGIDYAELVDRQALASVTAGLIDPGVAHTLPRYTAWDHAERARTSGPLAAGFAGRASRRASTAHTLAAADGGHAALYFMADGARGVSLELQSIAQAERIVRLTRLR